MIAIVGMGNTSLAVARWLRGNGSQFVLMDTRVSPPQRDLFADEFPGVGLLCGPLDADTLLACEQIIVSPGVALSEPALQAAAARGIEILGDIELFARSAKAPIIAITGSNGKTTVTTLVGKMLKAAGKQVLVGGNIGTPALELLKEPVPDVYVLELSSFQLETTLRLNAHAAVVLNLSRDHMDRYESLAGYHAAKTRIFFGAKWMVVNREDPLSQGPVAEGMSVVKFGLSQPDLTDFGVIYRQGQEHLAQGLEPLLPVQDLQLLGAHNVNNVLAALALVNCVTQISSAVLKVVREFSGVAHRCMPVPTDSGIVFINDSKATNVGATLAAVQGLSKQKPNAKIHLLLGGQGKGGDFTALAQGLTRQVGQVFVYGEDKQIILEAIAGKTETHAVANLEQAVRAAVDVASKGDIVLLSPACASFDMFSGFEARGEAFEALVKAIAHD